MEADGIKSAVIVLGVDVTPFARKVSALSMWFWMNLSARVEQAVSALNNAHGFNIELFKEDR